MFDVVRNNKRIVQGFLLLITLPFAFWGIDSYIRGGQTGQPVAKIGDSSISQQQFSQALRDQRNQLQQRMGAQFDPKLLDQPAIRQGLLDELINQNLLIQEAARQKLYASDAALRQFIGQIPAFTDNGKFSQARYEAALAAQGMSPAGFEAQLRRDLTLQQMLGTIGDSGFISRVAAEQVAKLQSETRSIQSMSFATDSFAKSVQLSNEQLKAYYEKNAAQFEQAEQIKVDYVALTPASLRNQITVSEADLKSAYEAGKSRFQEAEERRASHILIAADEKNGGVEKARTEAETVLKSVQANPAKFAELAKTHSQDPGSARQGGDLGFFGKGMMVPPFEAAVWKLKEGEISGLVQSDFGFHIIKLTGIKGGKTQTFESVRSQLEGELRQQAAARKFAEASELFGNMAYEQSDSLQPVAEKFHLSVQRSGWLTRGQAVSEALLNHPRMVNEMFGDDVLNQHRNSQVVEVAKDTLVAVRLAEHKPKTTLAFEAVRQQIEHSLKAQEAQKLAEAAANTALTELKSGKDTLNWTAPLTVSRLEQKGLSPQSIKAVFSLPNNILPGYANVELGKNEGFRIYKLRDVQAVTPPERFAQGLRQQLAQIYRQADVQNYLSALRLRYKVEINQKAMLDGVAEQ